MFLVFPYSNCTHVIIFLYQYFKIFCLSFFKIILQVFICFNIPMHSIHHFFICTNNSKSFVRVFFKIILQVFVCFNIPMSAWSFIFISWEFIESQKRMHSLEQFLVCLCANVVCARIVNNWGCYPKKCLFSWNSFWKIHFVV